MLNLKIQISALVCLLFVALPHVSSAYFSTEQHAFKIDDTHVLYTVSYSFGTEKYALNMPVGAVRGLKHGDASPYLGYSLVKNGEEVITDGEATALVLSSTKVENGSYIVKRGEAANFVLFALVTLPAIEVEDDEDYDLALQVTSLPFVMTAADGTKTKGQLNPSELQYYVTPNLDID